MWTLKRHRLRNLDPFTGVVTNATIKQHFGKLPEDNPICKELGHIHLIQIVKEEDWWSGTAHCSSCYRCGWSDPCPFT